MTLTLHLSPDLEQYLAQEAQQSGLTLEALALQLLSDVVLKQRKTEAANLLQSWLGSEEKAEQQETGKYLIQALEYPKQIVIH